MKTERENTNVVYKGYANPTVALITPKLLTVNYYDDYSFLNKNAITEFNNKGFGFAQEAGFGAQGSSAKSLPTGTLTAQLDNATTTVYHGTVMYYDDIKQMIQCISGNHLEGKDKEHIAYNFTGQPTNRKHVHVGNTTRTEYYAYTYDHAGRLKKTTHRVEGTGITNPVTVILAENTYDELGRLACSKANDNANLDRTYQYNVRSWIKEIGNTHFLEKLAYNYNGNIATQEWEQAVQTKKTGKYTFTYDGLSRLKSAVYTGDGSYGTTYSYDKLGNITRLTRNGNTGTSTYGMIDNLTLDYNGNQLLRVTDTGVIPSLSNSADFRKISTAAGTTYAYDANGNLKRDPNKGITEIKYNLLNLPTSLSINNTLGQIVNTYVYTVSGKKLKESKGSFTTDYVGNMIYENNSLKRILVDNGYYENGMYYFYVRDHLGNNRVVADQNGNIIQSTQYYPFGMSFADELGPSKQPYKYNGKELDSDKGLNLYDYEARYRTADVPSFTTMDPLAEKYYSISPYAYCKNNPLKYIDPSGMWIQYSDSTGIYRYEDGQWHQYQTTGKNIGQWTVYTAQAGSFLAGALDGLNQLRNSTTGKNLLSFFENDMNNSFIKPTKGGNMADISDSELGIIYLNENFKGSLIPVEGGGVQNSPFWLDIGHELAHRQDVILNGAAKANALWFNNPTTNQPIPNSEKYATHIENLIRAEAGMLLRTHYARQDMTGWENSRILNSSGVSIFYGTNYQIETLIKRLNQRLKTF